MGLLDDAIREHLELKRRHGADPDEVARQENEALGETRRAEFARPEGADPGTPAPPLEEPVTEAPPAPEPVAEPEAEPEPVAEVAPEPEPVAEVEPEPEPVAAVEAGDEREPFDIEAVEPPAAAEPAPRADDPWLDEEPDEVPAEEALDRPRTAEEPPPAAEEPPPTAEEDVLEETPDFLQATPEHDRLWFEQRPPRDFDWDK
jgi:hypothetical protein